MKTLTTLLLTGLVTFGSAAVVAEEEGSLGFSGNVGVDGIFDPDISSFEVDKVVAGSAAEAAGLKAGDKVVAIGDCKIPGCDTDDAQELMKVAPGEEVVLTIEVDESTQKTVVIKAR